jgi:hypothetical protein
MVPDELKGIRNGTIRKDKIPANKALNIKRLNAFMSKAYFGNPLYKAR